MKKQYIFLLSFLCCAVSIHAQVTVSTLAGTSYGAIDGVGTAAQFRSPVGITIDAAGNMYVADSINHRIRKITPAGVVTTFAGSTQGFANGTDIIAMFDTPTGITIDTSGNLYVADSNNHKIRKITPTGVVSTVAGSTQGFADGTNVTAMFNTPSGVAIDASGNLYVADSNNQKIRKITPTGLVSTFAGSFQGYYDSTGASAQFNMPFGITIDSADIIYVADKNNSKIRKITTAGVVSTLAGSSTGFADGISSSAKFTNPYGLSIDTAGNVFVADGGNNRIRKITPSGVVTTFAGSTAGYIDNNGTAAQFNTPEGIVTDAAGNLYVTDANNQRIRKITSTGDVSTLAGSSYGYADGAGTTAQFNGPWGMAIDSSNNLYVADQINHKIRKITPSGVVSTLAGSTQGFINGNGISAQFNYPSGIAIDASDNVFVADQGNEKIRKITPSGSVSTFAGSSLGYADGIGTAAQFYNPCSIATDTSGNLYVADSFNFKVRKITPSGVVSTFAGSSYGYTDSPGTSAQFAYFYGVATDLFGNVFVSDYGNNRIRKIDTTGGVTTLAGSTSGNTDGIGNAAQFYSLNGIATDAAGNVYVADSGNHSIRKITPAGVVSTLAGSTKGFADGDGASALFDTPSAVAIDTSGNLYVADSGNNKIRKITQTLSVNQNDDALKIIIYPNPVSSTLTIQIANDIMIDKVIITDLLGKNILNKIQNTRTVNVENLAIGIYIIEAYSDGKKYQTKFIKE